MNNWKRRLLRIWLALSLLWSVGLIWWLLSWSATTFAGTGWGFFGFAVIIYIAPLGTAPPLLVLGVGILTFWIIERVRAT